MFVLGSLILKLRKTLGTSICLWTHTEHILVILFNWKHLTKFSKNIWWHLFKYVLAGVYIELFCRLEIINYFILCLSIDYWNFCEKYIWYFHCDKISKFNFILMEEELLLFIKPPLCASIVLTYLKLSIENIVSTLTISWLMTLTSYILYCFLDHILSWYKFI